MLCTFTANKFYAYLLNVEPNNLVFLETCNAEFDEIIIIFTDENGRPSEIEDKVNLTLLLNVKLRAYSNLSNVTIFYRTKSKKIC